MRRYPVGKGLYVWIVNESNWQQIATDIVEGNFHWACLKIANGNATYNDNPYMQKLVDRLKNNSVEVWGWQYNYLFDPSGEAKVAASQLERYDLAGFVLDPEKEAKGKHVEAEQYMVMLLSLTSLPIGLSSYRYPSYHPELPWKEFLDGCDFHAPQVYWEQSHNPGDQLRMSANELLALRDLPVIPAGSAYRVRDWSPTDEDILEFFETAQDMELPGIFYWAWHSAADANVLVDIKAQNWAVVEPPPPPPPPPPDDLEQRVISLENETVRLDTFITNMGQSVIANSHNIARLLDLAEIVLGHTGSIGDLKASVKDLDKDMILLQDVVDKIEVKLNNLTQEVAEDKAGVEEEIKRLDKRIDEIEIPETNHVHWWMRLLRK